MSDEAIKSSKRVLDPIDGVSEVLFGLIAESSKSFEQARRYIELTQFESEESSATDQVSTSKLENILARAEEIFASAKSLVQGDERQDQTRTALLSEITAEVQRLN